MPLSQVPAPEGLKAKIEEYFRAVQGDRGPALGRGHRIAVAAVLFLVGGTLMVGSAVRMARRGGSS